MLGKKHISLCSCKPVMTEKSGNCYHNTVPGGVEMPNGIWYNEIKKRLPSFRNGIANKLKK